MQHQAELVFHINDALSIILLNEDSEMKVIKTRQRDLTYTRPSLVKK